MSPHESTAIAELTDEVRAYRRDVAVLTASITVLTTKLFGDPNNENLHGRLPVMEAAVEDQGKRIRRQERLSWIVRGAISAIVVISALVYEITNIKGH